MICDLGHTQTANILRLEPGSTTVPYMEDFTRVVISNEFYETGLRRIS